MPRRALSVLLAAAFALGLSAGPAGAAMPKRSADIAIPCGSKVAKVWYRMSGETGITQLAAKNPCSQWLTIWWSNNSASDPHDHALHLAPGKYFNWTDRGYAYGTSWGSQPSAALESAPPSCSQGYVEDEQGNPYEINDFLVYSYKDVRVIPTCS